MTTLQEAARDALEALERIGKDFVCRSAHHAKKDQHSAFAECPVVVRHTDAIESLRTALAQPVGYVRTINGEPTPDDNNTVFSYGANPYRDVMGNEEWVAVYTAAPAPAPQPAQGELEK